ncbi:helix-turn-helix transcriptional regulator [Paenibacillus spiritus]|uniref:helix-turn-helix transcriptional regulator n=1 Tax=Paenibacillus spiritus TaxID=2496557 RepID=UPI00168AACB7|nr:YafY family protein [Paenibacillus spiritus]
MKTDRLLGIVIYLLNRERVTARVLAEHFEVSVRTIQRDIESLGMAGIPVAAAQGAAGGYYILDGFRLSRQPLGSEDFRWIAAAVKGLESGFSHSGLEAAAEKMTAAFGGIEPPPVQFDLGAYREGRSIQELLPPLVQAALARLAVEFDYYSAQGVLSRRCAEPVQLLMKWNAWYMLAYCRRREDYRLFRLSRMRNLRPTASPFSRSHPPADTLLKDRPDERTYLDVRLRCPAPWRIPAEEAFPNASVTEEPDQGALLSFSVPEEESGWFGRLLALAPHVDILGPPALQRRIADHARSILTRQSAEAAGKDDIQVSSFLR